MKKILMLLFISFTFSPLIHEEVEATQFNCDTVQFEKMSLFYIYNSQYDYFFVKPLDGELFDLEIPENKMIIS